MVVSHNFSDLKAEKELALLNVMSTVDTLQGVTCGRFGNSAR